MLCKCLFSSLREHPHSVLTSLKVDSCNAQDVQRYREFLARRYGNIQSFNQIYGLVGDLALASFHDIYLPEMLATGGVALNDWIEFVSSVMAIKRNAHQFTVLVPAYVDEDPLQRRQRLEKTREVVSREKPAHSNFDVKLYWALFRVGSARLGQDSIIGDSSRYVAMTLNQEYLGHSYLAAAHPFNLNNRYVTDCDRLQEV